jgi:hypothetical protein
MIVRVWDEELRNIEAELDQIKVECSTSEFVDRFRETVAMKDEDVHASTIRKLTVQISELIKDGFLFRETLASKNELVSQYENRITQLIEVQGEKEAELYQLKSSLQRLIRKSSLTRAVRSK